MIQKKPHQKTLYNERAVRWTILLLLLALPLTILIIRWLTVSSPEGNKIEIHAQIPESGGWSSQDLTAEVGKPLYLRLVSDDVVHGFAIGQSDLAAIDLLPGKVVETTLMFDHPGKYVFYCTRWCGINHWRMRGTIEVSDPAAEDNPTEQSMLEETTLPLFLILDLDIDTSHPAEVLPNRQPSATRGAELGVAVPEYISSDQYYLSHSPAEIWYAIRQDSTSQNLSDEQVWDLVALNWRSKTSSEKLELGKRLYAENCAACHGEDGAGNGVMADSIVGVTQVLDGHNLVAPADFTNPNQMLGASPAILQGKIIRGGMGTGMPYWGPILTDEQSWALVDHLWTFQLEMEAKP